MPGFSLGCPCGFFVHQTISFYGQSVCVWYEISWDSLFASHAEPLNSTCFGPDLRCNISAWWANFKHLRVAEIIWYRSKANDLWSAAWKGTLLGLEDPLLTRPSCLWRPGTSMTWTARVQNCLLSALGQASPTKDDSRRVLGRVLAHCWGNIVGVPFFASCRMTGRTLMGATEPILLHRKKKLSYGGFNIPNMFWSCLICPTLKLDQVILFRLWSSHRAICTVNKATQVSFQADMSKCVERWISHISADYAAGSASCWVHGRSMVADNTENFLEAHTCEAL